MWVWGLIQVVKRAAKGSSQFVAVPNIHLSVRMIRPDDATLARATPVLTYTHCLAEREKIPTSEPTSWGRVSDGLDPLGHSHGRARPYGKGIPGLTSIVPCMETISLLASASVTLRKSHCKGRRPQLKCGPFRPKCPHNLGGQLLTLTLSLISHW